MKQLKYNSDMIARLTDLIFRISNDVRGVGNHAYMVQTQLEQVAKSQRGLLDEMNNNISDFAVRVATRGGKMTQEPLYPELTLMHVFLLKRKRIREMIGLCMPLVNLK